MFTWSKCICNILMIDGILQHNHLWNTKRFSLKGWDKTAFYAVKMSSCPVKQLKIRWQILDRTLSFRAKQLKSERKNGQIAQFSPACVRSKEFCATTKMITRGYWKELAVRATADIQAYTGSIRMLKLVFGCWYKVICVDIGWNCARWIWPCW